MKTKLVYVLVSNEKDYYSEQFFISSYSAKLHNPGIVIALLTDDRTDLYIKNQCKNALAYVDEVVKVDFPDGFDNKKRSRYLKTSVRQHIEGNYLFVDTDTVICGDLSDIDIVDSPIAAVYDMHVPVQYHVSYKEICFKASLIGYEVKNTDEYYNSGIMYVEDSDITRAFYEKWQDNYKRANSVGVSTDQQALLKTNAEFNIIKPLGGEWNCQIINNLEFVNRAKIIHYYCSGANGRNNNPPYKLMSNDTCKKIRQTSFAITDELESDVRNAKALFMSPLMIMSGEDMKIIKSLQFFILSELYYRNNKLFKSIEGILSFFRKGLRRLIYK